MPFSVVGAVQLCDTAPPASQPRPTDICRRAAGAARCVTRCQFQWQKWTHTTSSPCGWLLTSGSTAHAPSDPRFTSTCRNSLREFPPLPHPTAWGQQLPQPPIIDWEVSSTSVETGRHSAERAVLHSQSLLLVHNRSAACGAAAGHVVDAKLAAGDFSAVAADAARAATCWLMWMGLLHRLSHCCWWCVLLSGAAGRGAGARGSSA